MKIEVAPHEFRPVSITLETQDELDQLLSIITNVAENRINHTQLVILEAKKLLTQLNKTQPDYVDVD